MVEISAAVAVLTSPTEVMKSWKLVSLTCITQAAADLAEKATYWNSSEVIRGIDHCGVGYGRDRKIAKALKRSDDLCSREEAILSVDEGQYGEARKSCGWKHRVI